MKKQNTLFGIGSVLILVLGLTLVSGYVFGQTSQQWVNAARSTANGVTEIKAVDGSIARQTSLPTPAQGIDITNDDVFLVVTRTQCAPTDASCANLIDVSTYPNPAIVYNINVNPANFVAITPPLAAKNNCRYAFITNGRNEVKAVNLCNIADITTVPLPAGAASYGVTVANFSSLTTPEVLVVDQDNYTLYPIDPVKLTAKAGISLCPGDPPNCSPLFPPQANHVAVASISATEYRAWITDGISGNKAAWVIKNTISNGQVVSRQQIFPSVRFTQGFCDIGLSFTYGIAVKPDNSTIYVTSPGNNNRIYSITNLGGATGGTPGCSPGTQDGYVTETFANPRGVAWLSDGRAYVGNAGAAKASIVQADPNQGLGRVNLIGSPFWVVPTYFQYALAPGARVQVGQAR